MEPNQPNSGLSHFDIIFEKLEEAKTEQGPTLNYSLEEVMATNEAILLLSEFQIPEAEGNYTYFTRS